jgi:phosphoesterase RecJ-like protein
MTQPIDWLRFQAEMQDCQSFILTSHLRPDADALGSELALASLLRKQGKKVTIVNPGQSPEHLLFLDPTREIRSVADLKAGWSESYDALIVVDTASWQQLGDMGSVIRNLKGKKFIIDHHLSADDLGASEYKDTTSPASGCLIYLLAKALGWSIDTHEAISMFAAICTDTGWFRFPATTALTYQIAADLINLGVQPNLLYRELYEQGSLSKLQLSGTVLTRVKVDFEGRIAYTYVSQDDFKKTHAHPADTENLVNECLKIQGTEVALIFVEQMNRQIKISFRSRGQFDVAKIAEHFNGGGHRLASGATLKGPLNDCILSVLEYIRTIVHPPVT